MPNINSLFQKTWTLKMRWQFRARGPVTQENLHSHLIKIFITHDYGWNRRNPKCILVVCCVLSNENESCPWNINQKQLQAIRVAGWVDRSVSRTAAERFPVQTFRPHGATHTTILFCARPRAGPRLLGDLWWTFDWRLKRRFLPGPVQMCVARGPIGPTCMCLYVSMSESWCRF